ncbi:MAG: cysteine desulfurase [Methanobacteriaceae archaeon]
MKTADMRADIPLLEDFIYLDAASTTPTPRPVVEAMCDYFYHYNANTGRGAYRLAVKATRKMEQTRETLAKFLKADPKELIFTKNTTEAINMVARGINFRKGDKIVVSNMEHHSNLVPWLNLKKIGVEVEIVKANPEGVINPSDIENAIDKNTKLLSITHISNSMGSVQPVKELGKIAREKGILYLIDAAQSAGHIKINVKDLLPDFIAFPGHKGLLGPVGTGFLYCNLELQEKMEPITLGGGTVEDVSTDDFQLTQYPNRFEGGTQNIAGFIGLGAAVDYVDRIGINKIEKHDRKLTKILYNHIHNLDGATVYGSPENIYGIVSFNIDGINPHDLAKILDETKNICVRSGQHCAIPSIEHLGAQEAEGTVRASFHYYNTTQEVKILGECLEEFLSFGDKK